jgi:shikimate kinase/3-dehydroquinate synthase
VAGALDRHLALVGFMGAGKSTLGAEAAERLGRRFVDVDAVIERHTQQSIPGLFSSRGEPAFRAMEQRLACDALDALEPAVISLGGGAVLSKQTRRKLRERAHSVFVDLGVDVAWERARGSGRPLAVHEEQFRALYDERRPLYGEVADAHAADVEGIVLAAAGIHVEPGAYPRLAEYVEGPAEAVVDEHVLELHPPACDVPVHAVPRGEAAKTLSVCDRLWQELRLERGGSVVAVGGGSTTDVAGLVAAAYLRGIPWIAVPTTLVGQVDAAIGGKTAIDLPQGKNLVGAFHWPVRTLIDPELLATLPEAERRNGLAEAVKTGLLAGEPFWELPDVELVRACAAFKAAVCLRDPLDGGERAMLNLGHTFAHALEAASEYELAHGEAVALGLVAALELSGLPDAARQVEEVLKPSRPRVDGERAWAALQRDKKTQDGRVRLVLLEAPGRPRTGVELPPDEVRRALEGVIA